MVERRSTSSRGRAGGSARAVERTLDILMVFLREGRDLRIAELSRAARLPKSTVHRLVKTLVGRGFLARDDHDATYRVGLSLFRLGSLFPSQNGVRQAALPVIRDLSRLTGETVNLNVVIDHRRVCIEKAESTHDIRHFVELGRPLALHGGASGMALLAFLDDAEIEAVIAEGLRPLTPRTITSPERLRRALAEIRRRGYAISSDERVVGASAVSAPIRDGSGRVVAGLTISGPTYRFTPERVRRYVEVVHAGAARISEALGYQSTGMLRLAARRQSRRASVVR